MLTGTPLENRIDEIYFIVEFLDPGLLGPLFRFNHEFYQLDDRGKPVEYKNLDELLRRVRSVMLRRRKEKVEGQLLTRTVNNFFVSVETKQRSRYEEYQVVVARLAALAQRLPGPLGRPRPNEELAANGVLQVPPESRLLFQAFPSEVDSKRRLDRKIWEAAQSAIGRAERPMKMVQILVREKFQAEALAPLW